jgi:drug/metabolite transporter (DMT)-like permease
MSASETPLSNLFWFAVIGAAVTCPLALADWKPLSHVELAMILAITLGATACHGCIFKAFQAADASAVAPVGYLGLPIGLAAAILVFGEAPGPSVWLGGAIILAACAWVARGR